MNNEEFFLIELFEEDAKEIYKLYKLGKLQDIFKKYNLDAEVIDLNYTTIQIPKKYVALREFKSGNIPKDGQLQTTTKVSDNTGLTPRSTNISDVIYNTEYKEIYHFCTNSEDNFVELSVQISSATIEERINIELIIRPTTNPSYILPKLTIAIEDSEGGITEVSDDGNNDNNALQVPIIGNVGDTFSIKIELDNISFIENFII